MSQEKADKAEFIAARKKRKLNQREWAKVLDRGYSSVTKWESEAGGPIPAKVMEQVRDLSFDKVRLKFDDETQEKIAKHLAGSNKTFEEFIQGLVKAALTVLLFIGVLCTLFHLVNGKSAPEAAIAGTFDAITLGGKAAFFLGCCAFDLARFALS